MQYDKSNWAGKTCDHISHAFRKGALVEEILLQLGDRRDVQLCGRTARVECTLVIHYCL
jgi:hypothetical protein